MSRGASVVVLVTVLSTAACDGRPPATPTSPEPFVQPPPSTSVAVNPQRTAMAFDVRGIVIDDFGTPVPGARVSIWIDYSEVPSVLTDQSGRYQLNFTGSP